MGKKKYANNSIPRTLIDVDKKRVFAVNNDICEISKEDREAEIKRLQTTIDKIRKECYSTNIALQRIQSQKIKWSWIQFQQSTSIQKIPKKGKSGF